MNFAFAALAGALLLSAWPPAGLAAEPASLTVTFEGIKAPQGAILFTLVDGEAGYDGKAPPAAQQQLAVSAATVSTTVTGLAPGRYAIKAFHDVDGDGKMRTNPFGMPIEPFAFSNNAVGMMGPAKWADAAFEVKAGANVHVIEIE